MTLKIPLCESKGGQRLIIIILLPYLLCAYKIVKNKTKQWLRWKNSMFKE